MTYAELVGAFTLVIILIFWVWIRLEKRMMDFNYQNQQRHNRLEFLLRKYNEPKPAPRADYHIDNGRIVSGPMYSGKLYPNEFAKDHETRMNQMKKDKKNGEL